MSATPAPNRLATEASPYLLQHARNPVDWYPWGPEAIERARRENRPILLSVGYSACHWCHVMERESFEDPVTADLMNAHFVNVKVDREERPDVDHRYQLALQLMGRSGGWPLTMFLTPELEPFFGGTYFPPVRRYGMPSFREALSGIADAWRDRRADLLESSLELSAALRQADRASLGEAASLDGLVARAASALVPRWDAENAGFGDRPKFPNLLVLSLWLRSGLRRDGEADADRVVQGLTRMLSGGVFDQLGGGLHRYSTDAAWTVPHFEKMLSDNALLLRLLADVQRRQPSPLFEEAASTTVEWLAREMTAPDGTFFSAQDADSEGEEGRYFVFTPAEVEAALGSPDAAEARAVFGITEAGNFGGGRSVLQRPPDAPPVSSERRESLRRRLLKARSKRVAPATDDKVIAGWNGLAIQGLAEAAGAFGRPEWLRMAARASEALHARLRAPDGLRRFARGGQTGPAAFAEDHAFLLEAELALFAAGADAVHLEYARWQAAAACDGFVDASSGTVFLTPPVDAGPASLPERPVSSFDNAVPSAASSLAIGLLRLHALDGEPRWEEVATRIIERLGGAAGRNPFGFPYLLCAADTLEHGLSTLVVTGSGPVSDALADVARRAHHPNLLVVAPGLRVLPPALAPLVEGKSGESAAWLCRRGTCSLPIRDPGVLRAALDDDARHGRS